MEISFDDNGWTLRVHNPITSLTDDEIIEVARLLSKQTVVVFPEPEFIEPAEQLRIAEVIGNVMKAKDKKRTHSIYLHEGVIRVTGKKDDKGEPGLFGHASALEWHANMASNKARQPIVWMYGAEHMEGSRTSFINMAKVYEGMSENLQKSIANLKCYFGYEKGRYSTTPWFHDHVNKENLFDLVMTTEAGITGLYYPFYQVFGMDGLNEDEFQEVHSELVHQILKDESYAYHHDWVDGQIILSDQWMSIHKRWEFDRMEERVLHRIALDYGNVYESYPYSTVLV
jgi:alpha-ketoglutarate-dependent taurine dioxygenase